ncbi:MAG TPA: hypothetical protein VHE13_06345 [Opitutus sp.]|nr:hypothetical protein [Opitutus sp.]
MTTSTRDHSKLQLTPEQKQYFDGNHLLMVTAPPQPGRPATVEKIDPAHVVALKEATTPAGGILSAILWGVGFAQAWLFAMIVVEIAGNNFAGEPMSLTGGALYLLSRCGPGVLVYIGLTWIIVTFCQTMTVKLADGTILETSGVRGRQINTMASVFYTVVTSSGDGWREGNNLIIPAENETAWRRILRKSGSPILSGNEKIIVPAKHLLLLKIQKNFKGKALGGLCTCWIVVWCILLMGFLADTTHAHWTAYGNSISWWYFIWGIIWGCSSWMFLAILHILKEAAADQIGYKAEIRTVDAVRCGRSIHVWATLSELRNLELAREEIVRGEAASPV